MDQSKGLGGWNRLGLPVPGAGPVPKAIEECRYYGWDQL